MDTDRKADTVSTMDEGKRQKRPRRSFTEDFKAGAVRLVLDESKTIPQVARDLDLTQSALRTWVEQARADRTKARPGSPARSAPSWRGCARRFASCGWSGRS